MEEISSKNKIVSVIHDANKVHHPENTFNKPTLPDSDISDSYEDSLGRLFQEIELVSGKTARISKGELSNAFDELLVAYQIKSATMWHTPTLISLRIIEILSERGIRILPPDSDLSSLASCDLGITDVDYALIDTGTLVLCSSSDKPRLTSLLPRVHLAMLNPSQIRKNLRHLLREIKHSPYSIFITGPSRTADIELTVSLGVHGPQTLLVWALEGE